MTDAPLTKQAMHEVLKEAARQEFPELPEPQGLVRLLRENPSLADTYDRLPSRVPPADDTEAVKSQRQRIADALTFGDRTGESLHGRVLGDVASTSRVRVEGTVELRVLRTEQFRVVVPAASLRADASVSIDLHASARTHHAGPVARVVFPQVQSVRDPGRLTSSAKFLPVEPRPHS